MLFTCGVMFLHYIIALIIELVKPFSYVAVSEGLVFLLHCKFPNQKKLDNLIDRFEAKGYIIISKSHDILSALYNVPRCEPV